MSSRRGFLRLLAAAPVAAPVIAREAAAKAGVTAMGYGMPGASSPYGEAICGSSESWVADWAKNVFSQAWKDDRWEEISRNPVGALDSDLASSRSLSLSAAVRLQKQRNFERSVVQEQRNASSRYLKAFGFEFKP